MFSERRMKATDFILAQRINAERRYNRYCLVLGAGRSTFELMSTAAAKKVRPKYLHLPTLTFHLPLPGWISILHRISGLLLVFPFAAWLLYLLDTSLASEQGFERIRTQYLQLPIVKLGLLVFAWAYCHHFCAGIRFLFLDLDKGVDLQTARRTSLLVLIVSLAMTAFFATKIW
jgi:succinate dehydrogenase / fumarate reductase cytochrome b subunit